MNAGDLKHRIIFQKLTTVTNDNGFDEQVWVDYKRVWSAMNNLFGKEYWSAKAVQAENTIEFVVRYSKEFMTMDTKIYRIKVLKDNTAELEEDKFRFLNITFIDNVKYENKWLKIKTVEVV